MDKKIIEVNTKLFNETVLVAKISPEQAYALAMDAQKDEKFKSFSRLFVIIADRYLFASFPNKLGFLNLTGYYVNIYTGKLEFVESDERIQLKHLSKGGKYRFHSKQ